MKRARGTSSAEVGTLLVSKLSTEAHSCTVRHKEEADRGIIFHCGARLYHVIVVVLDLATCIFCYIPVTLY